MSESRKHHFIPQVHLKKFKTVEGYHQYFIKDKKFVNKKTTIDIFSVKDLNTSLDSNGDFDYNTVEDELGYKLDAKFSIFFAEVIDNIKQISETERDIDLSQECLKYFFEYGVIGKFRRLKMENPYGENSIFMTHEMKETLSELDFSSVKLDGYSSEQIESASEHFFDLFNKIAEHEKLQDKLKYRGPIPTDIDILMPSSCSCDIFLASESSFILPDATSMIFQSDETHEHKGFKIPKVLTVCIPISPFIFILIKNNDIVSNPTSSVSLLDRELVKEVNMQVFQSALTQIITIDKEMLTDIAISFS